MSKKLVLVLLVISLLAVPLVSCKGLTLTVKAPMDGAIVTTPSVIVKGNVSTYKATVTVNEVKVVPAKKTGYFQRAVTLIEGENPIRVVATLDEKVVTKTITITYTPSE